MSADKCTEFQAHQWKKDICVNCMRSRSAHTHPRPKPRTKDLLGHSHQAKLDFLDDSTPSEQAPPCGDSPAHQPASRSTKLSKQTSNEQTKKSVVDTTDIENTSIEVSTEKEAFVTRSLSAREDIRGSKRKHRMSRPAGPPPEAPPEGPPTSPISASPPTTIGRAAERATEPNKSSHYYHKYDVSASLQRRGQQQPAFVDIESRLATASATERTELIGRIKTSMGDVFVEAVDITADQIAMPYNIVDVSAKVPTDSGPPQLPKTPAPTKEDSLKRVTQRKVS